MCMAQEMDTGSSYHRADLSATYFPKKNDDPGRRWAARVFSVYNVYNRANPYFLFFDNEGDFEGTLDIQAKQVSLFPILPSISWNFAFDATHDEISVFTQPHDLAHDGACCWGLCSSC